MQGVTLNITFFNDKEMALIKHSPLKCTHAVVASTGVFIVVLGCFNAITFFLLLFKLQMQCYLHSLRKEHHLSHVDRLQCRFLLLLLMIFVSR